MSNVVVQRRLAAILAADVVGYSRLMAADEEGTLARLQTLRSKFVDPIIARHNGRIVKLMGDGSLVEFASVVDAVRCAVEFQQGIAEFETDLPTDQRLRFRIGINLGDVIIEDEDIYGDGVNIASRLEGLAPPGGIAISEDAYRQVRNKIRINFFFRGEHYLKNIEMPVNIFFADIFGSYDEISSKAIFDKPIIAVLPFKNLNSEKDDDHFADGLTEDLISILSHWRLFPNAARSSVFNYKDHLGQTKELAHELGAKYLVTGSVRRAGRKVRVNVQLTDAKAEIQLWSERYDRDLFDIFEVQDEISQQIAVTLQPQLSIAETKSSFARPTVSMTAWDFVHKGLSLLATSVTFERVIEAQTHYQRAIQLDPNMLKRGQPWPYPIISKLSLVILGISIQFLIQCWRPRKKPSILILRMLSHM